MIEVFVLGPVELRRDGVAVPVPAGKARLLLAALVVHANAPVSSDRLIDALWKGSAPPKAGSNLHVHVATLRKLLAGDDDASIDTTGGGYCLRIEPGRVDALRFERLVREARGRDDAAELLRKALTLWRGPALAEVADEPFVHTEARRLEELRLTAVEDRIDADLARGRQRELVPELEALVAANPLRERPAGQLMRALYVSGRQADALAVYRDLRRRLVDEIGIEPSPDLQALERGILQQDPGLATATAQPARRRRKRLVWFAAAAVLALVLAGAISAAVIVPGGSSTSQPVPSAVANSLVQLDPKTGRVVSVTPVGDTPVSLAVTPGAVWVVNRGDRTVSRVDRQTHEMRTIGGVPYAFDVAADLRSNIWVSDSKDPGVARISAGTGAFPNAPGAPERIHVPPVAGRVTVDGGYLWVTNAVAANGATRDEVLGARLVSRIDLRSHRVLPPIRTDQLPLVITAGYGAIWVGQSDASIERSSVSVIGTGSSRAETIDSGVSQPVGIAAGAGSIWVLKFDGTLHQIDPETRRVVARTMVGHEIEVLSIAVGAGYVWVTNRADFSVSKIDPRTGKVIRTIRLGRLGIVPCGIAATDDTVWVTMGGDTDCASPGTR